LVVSSPNLLAFTKEAAPVLRKDYGFTRSICGKHA